MKKGSLLLLFIASSFICIMIGTMIGRHTSANFYNTSDNAPVASTEIGTASEQPYLLNINTATLMQLDDLPGIGPALAQGIIDYRTEHGPFSAVDDLLLVEGIGEFRLNEIREYITTGG